MPRLEIEINHAVGLHARPAAEFVKIAAQFPGEIRVKNISADGGLVNAKSILSVLTLGVKKGHTILIEAEGERAEEAIGALKELISSNFEAA